MLSSGLRLLLLAAAPLVGAFLVHELRRHRMVATAITALAVATCAGLTISLTAAVAGGASVEHGYGTAIPGVDLTARVDSASVAVLLAACLAAALALFRHAGNSRRLCGVLLCLAGTAVVAAGGNLVLVAAGCPVIAGGALLLGGRHAPGARSVALLATVLGGCGLALLAVAAQLVAGGGSSDLAFLPQSAIGGAVAVPWALGGVGLVASAALPGEAAFPALDWAAIGALPSGYLVLLRLQQSAGGQLPGNAAVTLAVIGAVVAVAGAAGVRSGLTIAAAGRACTAVLAGLLVSLFGGPLAGDGTVLAGLFLALELALVAAPSWNRTPTAWSSASIALTALPGGAAFAIAVVGLGVVAQRGVGAFPQLAVLTAVLAAAGIAAGRVLTLPTRGWRPLLPGAVLAAGAGLAGGLVPGAAFRLLAAPLAGGAAAVDLDAGSLQLPGAGFAGGYFAVAAAVLLVSAGASAIIAGEDPVVHAAPQPRALSAPRLALLRAFRRRWLRVSRRAGGVLHTLDRWLEAQPGLPLFVAAAALAILLFH